MARPCTIGASLCFAINEFLHVLGKWSNPLIIGQCIPPASAFIIDKINNTRAVLFGGVENDDTVTTVCNNIYILEISVSTVVC